MNDAAHVVRTAPIGQAILWRPTERAAPAEQGTAVPIYIRQRALAALHDHLRGAGNQGILGFLVGDLCEDPGTQDRWLEIQLVVRLTQAIYGDKTTIVIARVWERLQQEIERTGGHMLGWYHSHPPGEVELGPNDLEAHEQYFARPWQVALVVGSGERGYLGAFYRPVGPAVEANGVLPFSEIVDPESITPEGKKRTRVTWKNYKPDIRRFVGPIAGMTAVMKAMSPPPAPTTASGKQPAISADASRVRMGGKGAAPAPEASPAPAPPPTTAPTPRQPTRGLPDRPAPPRAAPPPPTPPAAPPPPPARPVSGKQPAIGGGGAPSPSVSGSGKRPSVTSTGPQRGVTTAGGPVPRPSRFTQGRRPFAGMLPAEEKKGRLPLVLLVLAVLLGGGGAGYWFLLRPLLITTPAPAAGSADTTGVGSAGVPPATDSTALDTTARADTGATAAAPTAPPRSPASRPQTRPAATPPPALSPAAVDPLVQFDRVTDSLAAALRRYQDRSRRFDTGSRECDLLGRALVAVDEQWLVYNSEKRGLSAPLDAPRMGRDAELYATVDSVQAHFDRSGCPRP